VGEKASGAGEIIQMLLWFYKYPSWLEFWILDMEIRLTLRVTSRCRSSTESHQLEPEGVRSVRVFSVTCVHSIFHVKLIPKYSR
jgi:hypothetical protein